MSGGVAPPAPHGVAPPGSCFARPPLPASGEGWGAALRAALRMGISPDGFWRLSVREWRMLTGAAGAMKPDELAQLMARFPDGPGS